MSRRFVVNRVSAGTRRRFESMRGVPSWKYGW
jgi:hypothetical protein